MQLPSVDNLVRDPQRGITYNICAYRKLSRDEIARAMRVIAQQQRGHHARREKVIKIFSMIGFNGE
jgi:hypothetical protein